MKGPSVPYVVMDEVDWFAVVIETSRYGALLLVSVHLRPHYSFAEKKAVLRAIHSLILLLRPQATIIGGDFNCEAYSDTSPLYYALRSTSLFHSFHLAHPPGTLTSWTVVDGVPRSTGIDHILTSANIPPHHSSLLPSSSTHMGLIVTIDVHDSTAQPFHWKRLRWRLLDDPTARLLSSLVGVVWAFLTLYPSTPDLFTRAMWHYASAMVPRPPTSDVVIRRLQALTPTLSWEQLDQLSQVLRDTVAERGRERLAVTLARVTVTGATRSALRLKSQPLKPLSLIAPNPTMSLRNPEDRKAEIDAQAAANVQNRHLRLDMDWLRTPANPRCWERFFDPDLDLPIGLILQFLQRHLQPGSLNDRDAYCTRVSAEPVLSDLQMVQSITRHGSWASACDNTPRKVLQCGGFGVCSGVVASRRQSWLGAHSLSAMPLQYGLYKGKVRRDAKKPPHLMTSYRPVVAESPVTGSEAHWAKRKKDCTLEASGLYPQSTLRTEANCGRQT